MGECGKHRLLKPMVFLRHYCVSSEEDQQLVARLAGVDYPTVERKYKELLRMEDAPIKAVEDRYVIVNYEEAWMTLNIDISDVLSTRLYEEVISLLSRAGGSKNIDTQQLKARIHQLLYNYIYFAETGSDGVIIQTQIKNILKYTHCPGCADILLGELSNLSEAAPAAALEFIEDEVKSGIVYDVFKESGLLYQYRNILFALDQLVMANDTSVRACQVLYELCTVEREYVDLNSPKESLLNALCLWDGQTALTLDEKKILTKKFIRDNSNFGVPFAIGLISKDILFRGKRIGEKEPEPKAFSPNDLLAAYNEIAMLVFDVAVQDRRLDWIGKLLESYWRLSCKTISDAAKKFDATSYPPDELLSLHFQLRNEVFSINDYSWEDRKAWIAPLNEWVKCTSSDDRVGKIGWMFYKYYETPFEELLSLPAEQFDARSKRAKELRGEYFIKIKEEFGIGVALQLAHYMEDDPLWGSFLSENVEDKEYQVVVQEVYQLQKTSFLSGLLNSGNLNSATEAFVNLPENVQESILPKITRIDITAWLTSPKRERIYWESKTMLEYNEQVYRNLLRYNPCGLLHFLYRSLKDISNILDKIFEVFAVIADGSNCNNTDLIPSIILKVDEQHYSDKWAQLCLTLYNKGLLKSIHGYYPQCLRKYFFRNPSKMYDMFLSDKGNFEKHFYYHFYLPKEAYEDYGQFKLWADYLYEKAADNASLLRYIGYILGRSVTGQDGIFPHEFVRMILKEYRNDKLTLNVAYGKMNSFGVRTVEDGAKEQGMAKKYRVNARILEIDFSQTARILRKIADSFESDAKRDRLQSEIEPLF